MPLLSFQKLTPEQMQLLHLQNQKPVLSPKELFDIEIKRITHGAPQRMKKYHFKAIICGSEIFLFNGKGDELNKFSDDFHGRRACREFAFETYKNKYLAHEELIIGGYTFDFVE